MTFSMGYNKNIWSNRGRDTKAMYANELIYMVKKCSLVRGQYIKFRILFQSCKILGHVNKLTAL